MLKNKFLKFLDFRKGMVRDISETRLNENQLKTIKNCRIDKDGTISSRYGHSKQNATQIVEGNGNMITQLRESDGTKRFLSQFLNNIYHYADAAWTSVKASITNAIMNSIQFSDKIIMGNAVDNMMSYGKETNYTPTEYFYLLISAQHKIEQRLLSDFSLVKELGSQGSGNDQFNTPLSLCIYGSYIYIVDTDNHRIVKRNVSDLSFAASIGTQGSGNDQFDTPYGICTDGTHLYITDTINNRIKKHLCSDLSYVAQIGSSGTGDSQFSSPMGICTDNTNLYLCDMANNRIKKHLCSDLSYVAKLGSSGTGDNQFSNPFWICTDLTNLYITDRDNLRLKKHLCSDLSYVAKLTTSLSPNQIAYYGSYLYVNFNDEELLKYNTSLVYQSVAFTHPNYADIRGGLLASLVSVASNNYTVKDIGSPGSLYATTLPGGVLTGSYTYKTTWKTGSLESSGGLVSNALSLTSQKGRLDTLDVPTWLQNISYATPYVNIYRTAAGGSTYKLVTALLTASALTGYTDNLADGSLGATLPTINTLAPQAKYFAEYQGHIFAAGDPDYKSFLFVSGLYSDDDWYDNTSGTLRFIRVYENDGDDITGLKEYYGNLYIFKRDSIHRLTGIYPSYNVERLTKSRGTVSHRTICEYKRRLLFLSEYGIEILEGYEPRTLSDSRVQTIIDTINKSHEELSFAYIYKDKYYLWIPTGTNTYCDTCIVYDLILDCFTIDDGLYAISGNIFEDDNDNEIVYISDNNGFVWKAEDASYRNDGVPSGTINGTAAAFTATTLSGSAVSGVDFYTTGSGLKGANLYISSGTGSGQSRVITSNTAVEITVPTWSVTPDATSIYTIGAIDTQLITGKINSQEDLEHGFRELQSEDSGSGTLNYSVQVEGRTAETFTKTLTSDYLNNRYTPAAQWGKWFQATITQRKANDYFSHRSHTLWLKARGPYKEQ